MNAPLPRTPRFFQTNPLPQGAQLVGVAALVHALDVRVPVRQPAFVSETHTHGSHYEGDPWRIFDKRYEPGDDLEAHLVFALRHEELDLLVFKRICDALPEAELVRIIRNTPTGVSHRKLWHLYEWLTGRELDLADAPKVQAVDLLDPARYYTVPGAIATRHRVRHNLLGTHSFCPIIRRTPELEAFAGQQLANRVQDTIGRVSPQLVARAASFMLLADSQASYAIEGERPPRNKLERWGQAVLAAGRRPLSLEELERLHAIVIGDDRFIQIGLRPDGVFLGTRGADHNPFPVFIGARPVDLADLLAGLIASGARMKQGGLDPVLQAAALAFGFVYVHPFQDGNGRIHRCLIHQVLAERGFAPPGLVFPVSSVMADDIGDYQQTLEGHSAPLMPYIDWVPTMSHNVEVVNDTADLYRYFDCTEAATYLYRCVARTIDHDLPRELDYLHRYDEAMGRIMNHVPLSDAQASLFLSMVRQNGGTLGRRRRSKEFAKLTAGELRTLEAIVVEAFDGFTPR